MPRSRSRLERLWGAGTRNGSILTIVLSLVVLIGGAISAAHHQWRAAVPELGVAALLFFVSGASTRAWLDRRGDGQG